MANSPGAPRFTSFTEEMGHSNIKRLSLYLIGRYLRGKRERATAMSTGISMFFRFVADFCRMSEGPGDSLAFVKLLNVLVLANDILLLRDEEDVAKATHNLNETLLQLRCECPVLMKPYAESLDQLIADTQCQTVLSYLGCNVKLSLDYWAAFSGRATCSYSKKRFSDLDYVLQYVTEEVDDSDSERRQYVRQIWDQHNLDIFSQKLKDFVSGCVSALNRKSGTYKLNENSLPRFKKPPCGVGGEGERAAAGVGSHGRRNLRPRDSKGRPTKKPAKKPTKGSATIDRASSGPASKKDPTPVAEGDAPTMIHNTHAAAASKAALATIVSELTGVDAKGLATVRKKRPADPADEIGGYMYGSGGDVTSTDSDGSPKRSKRDTKRGLSLRLSKEVVAKAALIRARDSSPNWSDSGGRRRALRSKKAVTWVRRSARNVTRSDVLSGGDLAAGLQDELSGVGPAAAGSDHGVESMVEADDALFNSLLDEKWDEGEKEGEKEKEGKKVDGEEEEGEDSDFIRAEKKGDKDLESSNPARGKLGRTGIRYDLLAHVARKRGRMELFSPAKVLVSCRTVSSSPAKVMISPRASPAKIVLSHRPESLGVLISRKTESSSPAKVLSSRKEESSSPDKILSSRKTKDTDYGSYPLLGSDTASPPRKRKRLLLWSSDDDDVTEGLDDDTVNEVGSGGGAKTTTSRFLKSDSNNVPVPALATKISQPNSNSEAGSKSKSGPAAVEDVTANRPALAIRSGTTSSKYFQSGPADVRSPPPPSTPSPGPAALKSPSRSGPWYSRSHLPSVRPGPGGATSRPQKSPPLSPQSPVSSRQYKKMNYKKRNVSREIFEFMDMDDEIDTPPTKIPARLPELQLKPVESFVPTRNLPERQPDIIGRRNQFIPRAQKHGLGRKFTIAETENLEAGLKTFGRGKWKEILGAYDFHPCRTSSSLKDKARNLYGGRRRQD